ncbi:hypothetical protein HPB50_006772 [Hyalomma asiaticum]|uniref:Uncharacterized protein n=1 Tax=Hyalomma asiaticum TaxID=266040 RepID=A0ACB7S796_HYAAI|nr:hypothetical protein HPB50_006772 [Hyalomma asiaticum]
MLIATTCQLHAWNQCAIWPSADQIGTPVDYAIDGTLGHGDQQQTTGIMAGTINQPASTYSLSGHGGTAYAISSNRLLFFEQHISTKALASQILWGPRTSIREQRPTEVRSPTGALFEGRCHRKRETFHIRIFR